MLAEAVVLSGSVAVAALVPAGLVLVVPLPVPHEAALPVLLQLPPQPLLHRLLLLSLQAVVESEVRLHLQGRQSFSAAMARSSPPAVQPTCEQAPSTRSPPKGRPCPSACLNWMPGRG